MTKYELIMDYIKKDASATLKPHEKLPSIRRICETFNCSKATAVKAYDTLKMQNTIYSVEKKGYFLIEREKVKKEILEDIVDFSAASPDDSVVPYDELLCCVDKAINLYKESLYSISDSKGTKSLIEIIKKQLQSYQVFAKEENIFITAGSQQAINILTMMNFQNGKNAVLVEQPTYYGVLKSLELNNIKTIGIRRSYTGIDFNELERIFKYENIKFFYTIPRFHNPTGFSYSNSDKKIILKLCKKYNVYLVEDDYLGDLEVDKKADPIYAYDLDHIVIYLKSYSKVLMPGLRISAAVIPKALCHDFNEYKRWNDLNTSIISQGALEIYIKSGMYFENIKKIKDVYSGRMDFLYKLTKNNCENIRWFVPRSGYFASFEILNNLKVDNLIKTLNSKNIILKDSRPFFLDSFNDHKSLRLSISKVKKEDIKKGITCIINEVNRMQH